MNTIVSFLLEHVFECLHPVETPLVLISLVLVLCVEFVFQLVVQVIQLLIVALLVGLERVVNFFALIDGVLLNVLNLPIKL